MALAKLSVLYDQGSDVLYLSMGDPKPALTTEDQDGVLVRTDPESGKPIAVTVVDYEHHFRALPDVSWIEKRGLPEDLALFLRERPPASLMRFF